MSRYSSLKKQERLMGYLFILPNFIGVLIFVLLPVIAGLLISFTKWDLLTPPVWVGVDNYNQLPFDPLFWKGLKNSAYYALLTVPTGIVVSLSLALLVNIPLRGVNIFRTIYFVPVVTSITAISLVWKWLYNPEFGILNFILEKLGLPPQQWLNDVKLAMPCIALMSIWRGMGYNMTIFLAGIKGIPPQLYEAAEIDGANRFQKLWNITLPLLKPTLFFVLVMSVIGSLQVFGEIYVMTDGGPGNATLTYNYFLYQNAFLWFKMGYASSLGYILFVIIFTLTLLQFKLLGSRISYEVV
jgi:ABC-type sugar transport system permease subunit